MAAKREGIARAPRRVSLRHPYLVRISIGRIPMGPNALRFSERVLAILRAGGLPPRLAVQGYLLLIATVNGFTVDETGVEDSGAEDSGGSALALPTDPASRQEVADMARDYIASLPTEQFPEHGRPRRRVRVLRRRRALRDAHRHLRGRAGPPGGGVRLARHADGIATWLPAVGLVHPQRHDEA